MVVLRGCKIGHIYRYHRVLQDISLELRAGECFVLLGANGAGKTTLIRIFATLLIPTQGTFEIMGKESRADRSEVRRHLFFMGYGTGLYDDLTVIENIEFALGLRGQRVARKEIGSVLERVGIGSFSHHKSRDLSTGMQKRLTLAKAILARPSLLLWDEPHTALDEQGISVMNDCIWEFLGQGAAVLMSHHDRAEALSLASRVGILQNKGLQEITPVLGRANPCGT